MQARLTWITYQKRRLSDSLKADPDWYDPKAAAWYAWLNSVRINSHGRCLQLGRGKGVRRKGQHLPTYFTQLAERPQGRDHFLRGLDPPGERRCDNQRRRSEQRHSLGPAVPEREGPAVRPPRPPVLSQCREFALAFASPSLKVAFCGYEGDLDMPDDWEELPWGSQTGRGRERIWFSPHF